MENYQKWMIDALQEFKNSDYWHEEYDNGNFEITERGDIYLGNMHWIKNVVTSWNKSKHYIK